MAKWNSPKQPPEYKKYRGRLIAPMVIVRHRERQDKDTAWPKGVGIGYFTVNTKEWRLEGCNYECKVTGWMPIPSKDDE